MKLFIILLCLTFSFAFATDVENDNGTTVLAEDQEQPNKIITNGYSAYDGQVPYLVSLALRRDGHHHVTLCGGSIIAHTWVLTAAHCLNGQDYVDIYYGSNRRWNGRLAHRVRSHNFIQHHLWHSTNDHDIALIFTPHVNFNFNVNRIKLPTFDQMNEGFENSLAVTCGWGSTVYHHQVDWLQCADLQIMPNTECSRTYGNIPNGIMCVRTAGGKSTCAGDFGGPLVTREDPTLVGVASFVSGSGCMANQPAGFTRVTAHLDWIRENSGVEY